MPTGAHSFSKSQKHLVKVKVNCAKWRHLTRYMFTQLNVSLSPALDFSISQRAWGAVIKNFIDLFTHQWLFATVEMTKEKLTAAKDLMNYSKVYRVAL